MTRHPDLVHKNMGDTLIPFLLRVCIRKGVKQLVLSVCSCLSVSPVKKILNLKGLKTDSGIDIVKKSGLCVPYGKQSAFPAVFYLTS